MPPLRHARASRHVERAALTAAETLLADLRCTLTQDRIILEQHCNVALKEDHGVLALAWLTSHFQTGLRNLLGRGVLDDAVVHAVATPAGEVKIAEIPFDFSRASAATTWSG